MRQTGHIRALFQSLARNAALYVLAGAIWAVVLCGPAGAPPTLPTMAPLRTGTAEELHRALSERMATLGEAASRAAVDQAVDADSDVVWPVHGTLTGWFGERRGAERHPGLDIDGSTGEPVVAVAAGRVAVAGPAPPGYVGYGTVVIIDHGDGVTGIYAHLAHAIVKAGQVVTAGQRVGSIGTTGSVTGSHVHFEVRRHGVAVDPRPWLGRR